MCLAADVPLVESGTAGYLGQATVIKKVWNGYARASSEGRIKSIIRKCCWGGFIVKVTWPGSMYKAEE